MTLAHPEGYDLSPDWAGLAHGGIPINVSGGSTVGLELAAGLAYRVRAGLGVFGELGLDLTAGEAIVPGGAVT